MLNTEMASAVLNTCLIIFWLSLTWQVCCSTDQYKLGDTPVSAGAENATSLTGFTPPQWEKTGLYSNVISTSIQHTESGKWLIGKQYWKAKISKSWGVPAVIQWAQTVHSHLHCSSQLKGKGESSTQGLGKTCIWLGPGRLEYISNSEIFYFNL